MVGNRYYLESHLCWLFLWWHKYWANKHWHLLLLRMKGKKSLCNRKWQKALPLYSDGHLLPLWHFLHSVRAMPQVWLGREKYFSTQPDQLILLFPTQSDSGHGYGWMEKVRSLHLLSHIIKGRTKDNATHHGTADLHSVISTLVGILVLSAIASLLQPSPALW